MSMKIVYIAHPISGAVKRNLDKIFHIVKYINMNMPDVVPFALYVVDVLAMDDNIPEERERGIKNDTAILRSGIINEMWLYGDKISNGMKAEISLAKAMRIPVVAKSYGTKKELENLSFTMSC